MTMKPFYKRSEFWSHLAVMLTGATVSVGTVFDKTFLLNHPTLAAAITFAGLVLAGIATFAYNISRGLEKAAAQKASGVYDQLPHGG